MNQSINLEQINDRNFDKEGARIAFVQACWHEDIVDQSRDAFVSRLVESGYCKQKIDLFKVPGSFEIPLKCKQLANSGKYEIIVTAGLIVDGGIYRHEFVASAVIDGLMQVQLQTDVPILSVVLTPKEFNNGEEHRKFFFEHFKKKGREAADACIKTLQGRFSTSSKYISS